MIRKPVLFQLAIALSVFNLPMLAGVANAAAVTLVKSGQVRATIVVAPDASPRLRAAATTLQNYVFRSTGARLPIATSAEGNTIQLGHTAATHRANVGKKDLDQDGFILQKLDNRNFAIVGGSDWGTEFGVYDFLERCLGVRWLMPTETGTDVPRHRDIEIDLPRVVEEPAFVSRLLSPMVNLEAHSPFANWARFNRAKKRISFHHNLFKLFPVAKYAKTHPEFYPWINGKRYVPLGETDESWQPNFAAPGIVDAAVAEIEQFFHDNPEATSYSLGMNDSSAFDQSPESLARRTGKKNYLGYEDVSDDYFLWADAVVERVLQKYPDKWFGMLAYHGIAEPPTRVHVHPRIVPFLTYERMRWDNPTLRAAGQRLTQRWADVCPALGWYDYAYGATYQVPRIYSNRLQQNLAWGAEHHVKFSYAELYPNWGEGPKAWIYAKLLWNPNQNADALLGDWVTHCAGPKAATRLKNYYKIWERFWAVDLYKSKWNQDTGEYLSYDNEPTYLLDVKDADVQQADADMRAALQLADTPARKKRVAKLDEMWQFYKDSIVACKGAYAIRNTRPANENEALALLGKVEQVATIVKRRRDTLKAFRTDRLHWPIEWYLAVSPEAFGKNWGASQIGFAFEWAKKSALVRERLKAMESSANADIAKGARGVLQIAEAPLTLISRNTSFEEGAAGWDTWDKAGEDAKFSKGIWGLSTVRAQSGANSFSVKGVGRGALMQAVPYAPGTYVANTSYYVPQAADIGSAVLQLTVLNSAREPISTFTLPVTTLHPEAGRWSSTSVPFTLPEDRTGKAKWVRMMLVLNDFGPRGEILFDDTGIYRVEVSP